MHFKTQTFLGLMVCLLFFCAPAVADTGYPVSLSDSAGNNFVFREEPGKVVCLVPYVTQMLVKFGRADRIAGLTRQDSLLNAGLQKTDVGSVFDPDMDAVAGLKPDLIIASPYQQKKLTRKIKAACPVMIMEAVTLDMAFSQMADMGRLFNCKKSAAQTVAQIKEQLDLVARRLENEKGLEKKRVVRVMAGTTLSCPGDDSFQNEMIRAAGGIVPQWGKNGFAVGVSSKEWQRYNPQVAYGCSDNAQKVKAFLQRPEFKNVDAVKNGFIPMFPCELTCQASTRIGDFVQWLSAVLYPDLAADPAKAVTPDKMLREKRLDVSLPFVDSATVIHHRLADSNYKSLVLRFKTPQTVLSTLDGLHEKIKGCGNTFVPMAASLGHMRKGPEAVMTTLEKNLGFSKGEFAGLMTGADMDHLSISEKRYKDLWVTALATAGVRGNAMRMSKDKGYYLSHGTINIIVGVNRELSQGAMARALITVTEAKTAALTDLDIRSSYTPWQNRATGTGTDNIIVIKGQGPFVKYSGGHSKLAELMAKAVHEAVTGAIATQNGILKDRDIFGRLADRKLSLEALVDRFDSPVPKKVLIRELTRLFKDPYYAGFMDSALALCDAGPKGRINNAVFWDETCLAAGRKLSGEKLSPAACTDKKIAHPFSRALGTLISGIEHLQGKNQ